MLYSHMTDSIHHLKKMFQKRTINQKKDDKSK